MFLTTGVVEDGVHGRDTAFAHQVRIGDDAVGTAPLDRTRVARGMDFRAVQHRLHDVAVGGTQLCNEQQKET